MVDHALEWGWDEEKGGFFDGGYYWKDGSRTIINKAKVWWAEAEALNSLLLMAELHPNDERYLHLFKKQWKYIESIQIIKRILNNKMVTLNIEGIEEGTKLLSKKN